MSQFAQDPRKYGDGVVRARMTERAPGNQKYYGVVEGVGGADSENRFQTAGVRLVVDFDADRFCWLGECSPAYGHCLCRASHSIQSSATWWGKIALFSIVVVWPIQYNIAGN